MKGCQKLSSNRGLSTIGDVLPQLMVRYGLHRRRNIEQIQQAWQMAVGAPYSSLTQVEKIFRGTLTVKVPHNAFAQELSFRHSELIDILGTLLKDEKIKKIRFEV